MLAALGRRFSMLSDDTPRLRLVVVSAAGYAGMLAVLTWQALRGQSIVHPDAATASATAALVVLTLAGYALALGRRPGIQPAAPSGPAHPAAEARATTAQSGSPR